METLLLLFPQFSYTAQKEEVYFRMLGPGATQAVKMKDDSNRLAVLRPIFCVDCSFLRMNCLVVCV